MIALTKKQIAIGVLLFFVGLSAPIVVVKLAKALKSSPVTPTTTQARTVPRITPLPISKKSFSILFLGHGGAGHPGGDLADAIVLAHIIPEHQKVALITIPRDLWVPLKGSYYKINHALDIGNKTSLHGGGNLTKDILQEVTGLNIDYYVSVNFEGFKKSIDLLDGVTVNVPVTFDEYFYPIPGQEANICGKSPIEMQRIHKLYSGFELEKEFECRYEHLHFDKGPTNMDGNLALKFIRSRHSAEHGGDFARGERQQALLAGVVKKVVSLNTLNKSLAFAKKFAFAIRTDIDENILLDLLDLAGNPNTYQTTNINLNTDNLLNHSTSSDGQYILIPKAGADNWTNIQSHIHQNLTNN